MIRLRQCHHSRPVKQFQWVLDDDPTSDFWRSGSVTADSFNFAKPTVIRPNLLDLLSYCLSKTVMTFSEMCEMFDV